MIDSKSLIFIFFAVFLAFPFHSAAQVRCGTVAYEQRRKQLQPGLENSQQFEKWMKVKLAQRKLKRLSGERTQSTVYTIPVVVHVIHNGEPVGNGANISDAQIVSQINVINKDYPRLNADTVNTPSEFKPAAGSIDINFVLAKQDPEGLPTTGILRVQGTQTGWTQPENPTFKALSYWPAENYLNIWVVRFVDPTGIIGIAQLPVSDLPGLENGSEDRLTDGVAIDYRAFGTSDAGSFPDLYPQFNKGRTATHEIGHIFGLRHIWGDSGGCSSTDYCDDTPVQDASTNTCAIHPAVSCSHHKMFQNYMDYTNDPCMNIFTSDQIERMVIVLANSPRRASLLVSPGATDPTTVANDLGLKSIVSPKPTTCPTFIVPSVEIRNYGSNSVSSARIQLTVNGAIAETKDFVLGLAPLASAVVAFSSLSLAPSTTNTFHFHILLTNGGTDGKLSNDTLSQSVVVPSKAEVPLIESFSSLPSDWKVVNPDGLTTWKNVTAPFATPTNKAMYMDFYNYETQGEQDQLVTPVFDLSTDTAAVLKFDRAYAALSSQYNDQLRVLVSTGCDFTNAIEIFNKSGAALATVSGTSNAFVPKGLSDWKTETVSLNQFLGEPNVQVAFVSTNDYGNNLYLDNARIVTGDFADLKLTALKTPSPVICVNNPTPVVTIRNNGSTPVTSITIYTSVNGGSVVPQSFSGIQLNTGDELDFMLTAWSLNDGTNAVSINVVNADDPDDVNPSDNAMNLNEVVNNAQRIIPLRQNFDSSYPEWTIVSAASQMKWVPTATNKNTSLEYNAFTNTSIGSQAWLVSPLLDFSKALKSSLFFDISYAKSTTGNDRLQVLFSTDCGLTFPDVVFDQTGELLADGLPTNIPGSTNVSNSSWAPLSAFDWKRQYINLDPFVGNPQSRLALVVTNDHGNNLFIDNVELFVDDDANPVLCNTLYCVYDNLQSIFKITFNLPETELVRMQIFSTLGQIVVDNSLPDTLNQTYSVDMSGQQSGIYIVRLQMGTELGTSKVYVP